MVVEACSVSGSGCAGAKQCQRISTPITARQSFHAKLQSFQIVRHTTFQLHLCRTSCTLFLPIMIGSVKTGTSSCAECVSMLTGRAWRRQYPSYTTLTHWITDKLRPRLSSEMRLNLTSFFEHSRRPATRKTGGFITRYLSCDKDPRRTISRLSIADRRLLKSPSASYTHTQT